MKEKMKRIKEKEKEKLMWERKEMKREAPLQHGDEVEKK